MDNRRNLKIFVFLSTIILILYGVAGSFSVDAEESEDVVALENSDGFVIESEKVDGKMDLEEALGGNIDIEEGEIHGLKMTKKLNIDEEEAMIIIITSPGPIPVKDLKASLLDGTLPDFGGLCTPSEPDYACISDVTMTATEQSVSEINLPDATVKTCHESECDENDDILLEEDVQRMLEEKKDEMSTLKEINDQLDDDEDNLENIEDLIDKAADIEEEIKNETYKEQLEQSIITMIDLLTNAVAEEEDIDVDTLIEDGLNEFNFSDIDVKAIDVEELDLDELEFTAKEIVSNYGSFHELTTEFTDILEDISKAIDELEESVALKGESIVQIEDEENEMEEDLKQYADLIDEEVNTNENNESNSHKNEQENIDMKDLKERIENVKSDLEDDGEGFDELNETKDLYLEQLDEIENYISNLKDIFKELHLIYFEDIIDLDDTEDHDKNDQTGVDDSENENNTSEISVKTLADALKKQLKKIIDLILHLPIND